MKELMSYIRSHLDSFPSLKQFIKFCFVGGTAALINFSLLYGLVEYFGVWYVLANLAGGFVSAVFNFFSNKFWTFRNREKGRKFFEQGVKFSLVLISGVLLNTLLIYLITELFGLDYRLSWIFSTGLVTFWNYGLNRFWTFVNK